MPPDSNRIKISTVRLVRRLLTLTELLESRRYGMSRRDIYDAMPDDYEDTAAGERKFYRDIEALESLDRVVVLHRRSRGGEPPVFIAPKFQTLRMEEVDA